MRENIVYKIINKTNNRYYFGSTCEEYRRMKKHFLLYTEAIRQNNELHKDIERLGKQCFRVEILFRSNDIVEASRLESKLIRQNLDDKNMYNQAHGASGRRVFYLSDIIFIRQLYNTREDTIENAYEKYYKGVVTFRAFKKVWHGETFKNVCNEVFTEENKKWYFSKGQSRPCEKNGRSILTKGNVMQIRERKRKKEKAKDVFEDYKETGISFSGFYEVWIGRRWKNV